jgi:hypothetical protein
LICLLIASAVFLLIITSLLHFAVPLACSSPFDNASRRALRQIARLQRRAS